MLKRARFIFILIALHISAMASFGQLVLKPLNYNPKVATFRDMNPDYEWNEGKLWKWGVTDTLELPFFEDFTMDWIYPDSTKWVNNQVYVNRHFAVRPPSYGVATFDFLNEMGMPYKTLQKDLVGGGDTLTSQPIDLNYGAGDSVYLSFFYQARGRGDFIKPDDSLILQFRNDTGAWERVWARPGTGFNTFTQILIPVLESKYLHGAFQFRFRNWTHYWGNNNHWHIDHVYLNTGRNANDIHADDYAIQNVPTSILSRYASMPYEHYLADLSNEAVDSADIRISNRNSTVIEALVRYEMTVDGNVIGSSNFSDNSGALSAASNTQRRLGLAGLGGLSGSRIEVQRDYYVKESGRTNDPLYQNNDGIRHVQVFDRHFAYDDGSAESSFGFNDLNGQLGRVAVRFTLNKPDTLRGIGFMFAHNISNLNDVRYDIEVWHSIAIGGAFDEIATSIGMRQARYIQEINGYYYLILDEPIALDAGEFFIGWSQSANFNLSVGFDKNGGNLFSGPAINKDIYFNIGDGWIDNNSSDLVGAPMIRAIVGPGAAYPVNVKLADKESIRILPNPATDFVEVEGMNNGDHFEILDMTGRVVKYGRADKRIDVSAVPTGVYLFRMVKNSGVHATNRLIIN